MTVPPPSLKPTMSPQLPVEDPTRRGSLTDRITTYVWGNPVLRWVLIVTLADHVAAIALLLVGLVSPAIAGLLALFSGLTWFFAVVLPMMNREVRTHVGVQTGGYWSELVEMFGRVVLCLQTGLYTVMLIWAVASRST